MNILSSDLLESHATNVGKALTSIEIQLITIGIEKGR
jgi:hypothetical protein